MRDFYALLELIEKWADDRKITQNSHCLGQARKTQEETTELIEAATLLHIAPHQRPEAVAMYEDAIGDILITLIVGCRVQGVNIVDCLEGAYEEIKDRKGTLRKDGVFERVIFPKESNA